mmetsp:Transcript_39408/g.106389  ORF Transcript_39408/g.106389 Transcript_39408/m.106389 type:complete len:87 (-) Transcript_39408:536-796(-)
MATVHASDVAEEEDGEGEEDNIVPMLGSFNKKRVRADSIMPGHITGVDKASEAGAFGKPQLGTIASSPSPTTFTTNAPATVASPSQ